ncbi:MAG TPA: radical SAM protein [Polyangia bacterium]|nr:radical SAM protein [Polyangia bacterium]
MKIALVNPPPRNELDRHWAPFPVLGLAYVAASLRAAGHQVRVLDGKLGELSVEEIQREIVRDPPDLVGITCMTVEFPATARIAQQIRSALPAVPIVLGGAHVNAVGTLVLSECPDVDYACIGEGEHLVCELVTALERGQPVDGIPGLAFRRDGRIVQAAARDYHNDYDGLPFPAWDLFKVGEQIPLLTHRGCPFECNFCGHNSGFKPRYRSPQNVLAEMQDVVERFQPRVIRIEDETFGLNMARTKEILKGILARGLHERVRFSAQTRVDRLDEEFVGLLRRCRFETLELGVESGSPPVLERMGKGISVEQVERAVVLAKRAGLTVWCKFILGHPNETIADLRRTADFIARLNPDRLSVSIMTPFPGTPIFDMAIRGEGGYRLLSSDWQNFDKYGSNVLELEDVSITQLKIHQLWCYLKLYVWNGRLRDLARLALNNRGVVVELLSQLARAATGGGAGKLKARQAPAPAKTPAFTKLSDVAMPDATLARLRARPTAGRPAGDERSATLRSWAAPGA